MRAQEFLVEITRRDFLRGAGAMAGTAALGSVQARTQEEVEEILEDAAYLFAIMSEHLPNNSATLALERSLKGLEKTKYGPTLSQKILTANQGILIQQKKDQETYKKFARYFIDRYKEIKSGIDSLQSIVTEVQRGVMDILRDELPGWPDYVLKDMVISKIKSPQDLEMKLDHVRELATMAERWQLVQNMPLTFDMLDPVTRYRMKIKRDFGNKNPFMIPRDRERLEHALELVRDKGMENLPPVIMLKTARGLGLWEGWHRTMAAFRLHPEGFRVNAWIGTP